MRNSENTANPDLLNQHIHFNKTQGWVTLPLMFEKQASDVSKIPYGKDLSQG